MRGFCGVKIPYCADCHRYAVRGSVLVQDHCFEVVWDDDIPVECLRGFV